MTIDTIETLKFPPPPKLPESITTLEDVQAMADKLRKYFNSQSVSYNQLYNILHEGSLVETWQINNLNVGTLTAGTITSDEIYLGGPEFELDGLLMQIRVKDDQSPPVTRVEMGKFGAGADYGIIIYDKDGTVAAQFTSTSFIDGVYLKNATVDTGAIKPNAITKIASEQGGSPVAYDTDETDIISKAITTSGGQVLVLACGCVSVLAGVGSSASGLTGIKVYNGITQLAQLDAGIPLGASQLMDIPFNMAWVDAPSAAAHTYKITAELNDGTNVDASTIQGAALQLVEFKK